MKSNVWSFLNLSMHYGIVTSNRLNGKIERKKKKSKAITKVLLKTKKLPIRSLNPLRKNEMRSKDMNIMKCLLAEPWPQEYLNQC